LYLIKDRLIFNFGIIVCLIFFSLGYASYPFSSHSGYVVVFTDLHYPYKQKVVDNLFKKTLEINPMGVFLLGDLTEMGTDEEFGKLAKTLSTLEKAKITYRYILGNHDVRWSYTLRKSKKLYDTTEALYETFTIETDKFLFIGLDTTMYFQHVGHLGNLQIKWLKEHLEKANKNGKKVILLSHHPFGGPANYTDDGWKVLELLPNYDIPLVLSGHVHSYEYSGMYNWSWFQTLGAAKDGYMTVISWDEEKIYIWKYTSSDNVFELIKSVPLYKRKRQIPIMNAKLLQSADGTFNLSTESEGIEKLRITANGKTVVERKIQYKLEGYSTYEAVLNDVFGNDISLFIRVSGIGKDGYFQRFYTLEKSQDEKGTTLKKLWSFNLEDTIYSKPLVLKDGVVVADYSGNLLYIRDKGVLWRRKVGPVISNVGLINDNNILLGDLRGNVYLFTMEGKLLKQLKLKEPIFAVKNGLSTVAICAGRYLYILRMSDLSVISKHDLNGLLQVPALFKNGNYFQPSWDGKIYVINESGKIVERFDVGKGYYTSGSSTPELLDNLLIYSNTDGSVSVIDIQRKTKVWTLKIPGAGYSSFERQGDFVYISTINGEIYEINSKDGKISWNLKVGLSTTFPSLEMINTETLIAGMNDGAVAFLDSKTQGVAKIHITNSIITNIVVGESGIIITTADGEICCCNPENQESSVKFTGR